MKITYLSTYFHYVGDIIHFRELEDGMTCECLDNDYAYTSINRVWMRRYKRATNPEAWIISNFHHDRKRYIKEIQTFRLRIVEIT